MTTSGNRAFLAVCLLAGLLIAPPLLAQNPTGTLTGRVTDESGAGLPGVTVTATSPNLQGSRVTQTGGNGDYKLAFLPAGPYDDQLRARGIQHLGPRALEAVNAAQSEVVGHHHAHRSTLSRRRSSSPATPSADLRKPAPSPPRSAFDELEITRRWRATSPQAVDLVPGVHRTRAGPQRPAPRQRVDLRLRLSFENLWLINGVVINENLRGEILQPLHRGRHRRDHHRRSPEMSAEYGRFTGGVVNVITKSGGNSFDGSLRINLTNEDWESRTPLTSLADRQRQRGLRRRPSAAFCGRTTSGSSAPAATARRPTPDLTEPSPTSASPRTDEERGYEGQADARPAPEPQRRSAPTSRSTAPGPTPVSARSSTWSQPQRQPIVAIRRRSSRSTTPASFSLQLVRRGPVLRARVHHRRSARAGARPDRRHPDPHPQPRLPLLGADLLRLVRADELRNNENLLVKGVLLPVHRERRHPRHGRSATTPSTDIRSSTSTTRPARTSRSTAPTCSSWPPIPVTTTRSEARSRSSAAERRQLPAVDPSGSRSSTSTWRSRPSVQDQLVLRQRPLAAQRQVELQPRRALRRERRRQQRRRGGRHRQQDQPPPRRHLRRQG